jgi:hypothetical protein
MGEQFAEFPESSWALLSMKLPELTPEELQRYGGRYVAWNRVPAIVASGETHGQLFETLKAEGIDTATVLIDYVFGPDEDTLLY